MNILTIKNDLGEEKEYDILVSFTYNDKDYVTYTDYTHDKSNSIKCFTSEFKDGELLPIENEDVYNLVDELLNTLTEDTKKKYANEGTN